MKRDLLYVDDEIDNIVVFEATLEDDFNIQSAISAEDALALLEEKHFPVIVADQRMPGMTGVEFFEIIRTRFPDSKRILLTGYTDADAMADAINKGGIFHYLKKPWDKEELLSVLHRALETYDLEFENSVLTNRLVTSARCAFLGRVTARIAHEMGNQLCMLPLLEMVEEKYSDDADLVKVSQFTRETYQKLKSLIEEVKDFVRFEKETYSLHPQSLLDVVYELIPFLRYDESIPHERIVFQALANPMVRANKVKLQQVLVNLVHNAAHAIKDQSKGKITVTVDLSDTQGVLTISDNGCGMDEETQDKMWDSFFTTKGDAGNGLGMDVVQKIIRSHGGEITCGSQAGKGTTFYIHLPLVALEQSQESESPEEELVAVN